MNRRLPKFGFTNRFRIDYQEVNIGKLNELIKGGKINSSKPIDSMVLFELGVLRKKNVPYKVLGNGDINTAVNIVADGFSQVAKEKIEAVGGSIKIND